MIRSKTWMLGLAAIAVAGAAWAAPVSGVGEGAVASRLDACRATLRDAARDSDSAATAARRDLDSRSVLVTVEVAPCDCEENPAPTYAGERWRCLAGWRLVAMPERR